MSRAKKVLKEAYFNSDNLAKADELIDDLMSSISKALTEVPQGIAYQELRQIYHDLDQLSLRLTKASADAARVL